MKPMMKDERPDPELEDEHDFEGAEGDIEEASESEEGNATPEEQAAYDTVMTAVLSQLFGNDMTHNAIVAKLRAAGEGLAQEIGHTAAMILTSIDGAAEKQGREVPDDVLLHAGEETVAELVEVAIAAKLADEGQREELYKVAMLEGTKAFGEARLNAQRVTPEEMKQAGDDFREMRGDGAAPEGAEKPQPKKPVGPVAAVKAKEGAY